MAHNGEKDSVVTAGSGVQTSYYGKPVIKAPHWRWLIIGYLFLGGIAGASFTIGTLANLFAKDRSIERAARYLSVAALLPCPPLLILDLGRPDRFINMLRVVKLKSPMSLGSWALLFTSVFSGTVAVLQLLTDVMGREILPGVRRIAGIVGLPFSIFLSGYTGVLLSATNVPLWWRSFPLLSPTFISSAYSTSLAAMSLILDFGREAHADTGQRMARTEVLCLVAEIGFLSAALARLGRIGRPLTTGRFGLVFWPVTYVGGLLLPLLLQLNGPLQGRRGSRTRRTLTPLLTLVGGFSLRALMILAGHESAQRPEDYFAMTQTRTSASERT